MAILYNGDCLEEMAQIDDDSIDVIIVDLPYGQVSCKWDKKIDLEKMWDHFLRIKKLKTPIFMTCTTKFGNELINSAPKKCPFRYDIVWIKSASTSFLLARKMPMKKHEMIYVFYEKLPFYDLSSHTYKNIKKNITVNKDADVSEEKLDLYGQVGGNKALELGFKNKKYDPPLPVSVLQEDVKYRKPVKKGEHVYGNSVESPMGKYDPKLPVSVVKEDEEVVKGLDDYEGDELCKYDVNKNTYGGGKANRIKVPKDKKYHEAKYDPKLPVSVLQEDEEGDKGNNTFGKFNYYNNGKKGYDPKLPVTVVKEDCFVKDKKNDSLRDGHRDGKYDPPLPTTALEVKSVRGNHSTEKPVALMEWILKYFSKEGDVVLDNCMGSGSTGVACKNMNRNFIGIEMNPEIYEVACERIF